MIHHMKYDILMHICAYFVLIFDPCNLVIDSKLYHIVEICTDNLHIRIWQAIVSIMKGLASVYGINTDILEKKETY